VLIVLLPIGVLALVLTVGLFTLSAWLNALLYACETKFMAAGVWLCVGIFMVNALARLEQKDRDPFGHEGRLLQSCTATRATKAAYDTLYSKAERRRWTRRMPSS
jgi:hypothetical protein